MKRDIASFVGGAASILAAVVMVAAAQPDGRRCVGVAACADPQGKTHVYRALADGTVEKRFFNKAGDSVWADVESLP